jgi:hypothetical protein
MVMKAPELNKSLQAVILARNVTLLFTEDWIGDFSIARSYTLKPHVLSFFDFFAKLATRTKS